MLRFDKTNSETLEEELAQIDEAFGKLKDAFEAAILGVRRSAQCDKEDEHVGLRRIKDQVSLLSAISADDCRIVVGSIVNFDVIEWTAEKFQVVSQHIFKTK